MTTDTTAQGDALRDNWYFVSALGIVTLCASERDARDGAAEADRDWPHHAPHIPTQLAALASSPAPLGGADADLLARAAMAIRDAWVPASPGDYDADMKLAAELEDRAEALTPPQRPEGQESA